MSALLPCPQTETEWRLWLCDHDDKMTRCKSFADRVNARTLAAEQLIAWNRRTPPAMPTREGAITLAACPIGLFLYGDTLCLKTEYGSNEGRVDAYIVESGEFFWGDAPQTIASQRMQMVQPLNTDAVFALIGGLP